MRVSKFLRAFSPISFRSMAMSATETNTCLNTDINDMNINNNEMGKLSQTFRSVHRVMERPPRHWVGDAFHVYPVFGDLAFANDLSPFLMFDYAAPKAFPPSQDRIDRPRGVGQHPHRGFETVTIAFQGEVEHHDSKGNRGVIGPGDVQWMTAGKGIVHEEYHSHSFTREGGTFEMCQLWVNLPKQHKMTKPRYQAILKEDIPRVTLPLNRQPGDDNEDDASRVTATIRLIAGSMAGVKGPAKTFSPLQLWDVILPHTGSLVDIPFPKDQNCIVFVRRGRVQIVSGDGEQQKQSPLGPQDVAIMKLDGNSEILRVRVDQPDTSLLIMGGEPLNEPIAARGPFVMNTWEQIQQANMDYRLGKF